MSQPHHLKLVPLAVALAGSLYGLPLLAQSNPSAPVDARTEQQKAEDARKAEQAKDPKDIGAITVTGSLLHRHEYNTISPVQVITADTAANVGQVETAQILQKSSVAAGSTQINHQFGGYVVEGGTGVQTVSLRGLGAQRTLVLLNGNRAGPAGTRGQVGAFDLNVVPEIILQRAEILKDGASSVYGSDAVAGVVNLITRRSIPKLEVSLYGSLPQHPGAKTFDISLAKGFSVGSGSIVAAGSWYLHDRLTMGQRDFFSCSEDLIYDEQGNRIDREDRSILRGGPYAGCNVMLYNAVDDVRSGRRYVPAPDGVTVGLIPGYRPRANTTYANSPKASYEDVLNGAFLGNSDIINRQERRTIFVSSDFSLGGGVNWTTDVLYNQRKTDVRGYRQFFPVIGGRTSTLAAYRYANSPDYAAPVPSGIARPVIPFLSQQKIKVDYGFVNTALDGTLPWHEWTWRVGAGYSRSVGTYNELGISASNSGDVTYSDTAPTINYFDPGILSGERMNDIVSAIGVWHEGRTTYNQMTVTGQLAGKLFTLPAGDVQAAIGGEFRRFSINDTPSTLSQNGDLWGQSSAQITRGSDKVREIYGEIEIPLIKGKPFFEALTVNASARGFKYDSVEDSGKVWKLGASWQIVPSFRLRATKGTSYRAPGLYELYLGNQSGFLSQLSIDPCVQWSESNNDKLRANCAAAGIPGDYAGGGSSATIYTGGGAGYLKPETSRAFTAGFVFTPTFAPISIAVDYFSMGIYGQIASLGASDILGGCYGANVYPNNFCGMFTRKPGNDPSDPFMIDTVHATYININSQKIRGYDLQARYDGKFSFGKVEVEAQATRMIENMSQLFSSAEASGFEDSDTNGYIGYPKLVGSLRASLKRNDLTYTYGGDYVGPTQNFYLSPTVTYQGYANAVRKINLEPRWYHTASVRYEHGDWSLLVGIRNLLDTKPPAISSGVVGRYGNVSAFATQYDILGRSLFARVNFKF